MADGRDYAAEDRGDNQAFRDAARRAYGRDTRADRGAGPSFARAAQALRDLQAAAAGPRSAIPPELTRRAFVVGSDPGANLRIRSGDPFVDAQHCRIVEATDGSVWVEQMSADLPTTRVRRPDGSGVPVLAEGAVRLYPGDTLVVGRTEIPWTVQR